MAGPEIPANVYLQTAVRMSPKFPVKQIYSQYQTHSLIITSITVKQVNILLNLYKELKNETHTIGDKSDIIANVYPVPSPLM